MNETSRKTKQASPATLMASATRYQVLNAECNVSKWFLMTCRTYAHQEGTDSRSQDRAGSSISLP
jgi:hypothetical protein